MAPRLSMVMIVRDAGAYMRPCLESFGDHVDEIVCVDTGSRDGTRAEIRRVAREHGWTDKLVLDRFRWCDDFAAARNYAESLATCEFACKIDQDETVRGAEALRRCCDFLTPDVGSATGANMLCFQTWYYDRWGWWQRLARRGCFPYVFKVADPRPVRGGDRQHRPGHLPFRPRAPVGRAAAGPQREGRPQVGAQGPGRPVRHLRVDLRAPGHPLWAR